MMHNFKRGAVNILFLLFSCSCAVAQHSVYMNWNYSDAEKSKVFGLWKQYLNQQSNTDTLWCAADRQKYKGVDILKDAAGLGGNLYKVHFDCNVMCVAEMGGNYLIPNSFKMTGFFVALGHDGAARI